MARSAKARRGARVAVGLSLVVVAAAGCASATTSASSGGTSGPTAGSAPAGTGSASGAVLRTSATTLGTILVDSQGRTVYLFAADSPGHSACTGSCLTFWPPVKAAASSPSRGPGVTATLGALTRDDGTRQLTVDGLPVYTYAGDRSPGATNGQGKNAAGGLWWVLSPSGSAVKSAAGSPSSGSGGGGRGGYGY